MNDGGNTSKEVESESVRHLMEQPHSGLLGRNADHTLTVAFLSSASCDYRLLQDVTYGWLGENLLSDHEERQEKDGNAVIFAELHRGRCNENVDCASGLGLLREAGAVMSDTTGDKDKPEAAKPYGMLRLRSFIEKHRADVEGQDDGDGGLVIPCPVSGGADGTIVIRDAELLGYRPVVEGPLPLEAYVKALVGDKEIPDAFYLSKTQVKE